MQSPAAVERFFAGLLPSEADGLAESGDEASLRRALELEPGRADASIELARLLLERGERDEARELLEAVSGSFAADGLAARIRLEDSADVALDDAWRAIDSGDVEAGIDALIAAIADAPGHTDDLRMVVVGLLDELGVEHPLARDARRRLAAALY